MALEAGRIIDGKYRIIRLIGEGGMGAVYEAENARIQRRVAVKVLHGAQAVRAEAVQRFEREAQAAGRIGNDHILEVLDLGRLPEGDVFMVMEFLDGETLSGRIERLGRLEAKQAAIFGRQVLAGLGAAHAARIVHRDLKPENLFVLREKAGQKDFLKIIDFGISKFAELADSMKMTRTGTIMGTPFYMSPEQATGSGEADARSDLYSVAVILYEAVAGCVPFQADTFNQLLFKIALSEPPELQSLVPSLDAAFASIVMKGMAKDREQRFQSAAEFAQALETWLAVGQGVAVAAPTAQPSELPAADASSLPVTPPAGLGARTGASWATSGIAAPPAPAERRQRIRAVGASLAVGVLLLGGGLYGAYRIIGNDTGAHNVEAASFGTASNANATSAIPAIHQPPQPAPPKQAVVPAEVPAPSSAAAEPQKPPEPRAKSDRQSTRRAPVRPSVRPATKVPAGRAPRDFGY